LSNQQAVNPIACSFGQRGAICERLKYLKVVIPTLKTSANVKSWKIFTRSQAPALVVIHKCNRHTRREACIQCQGR